MKLKDRRRSPDPVPSVSSASTYNMIPSTLVEKINLCSYVAPLGTRQVYGATKCLAIRKQPAVEHVF